MNQYEFYDLIRYYIIPKCGYPIIAGDENIFKQNEKIIFTTKERKNKFSITEYIYDGSILIAKIEILEGNTDTQKVNLFFTYNNSQPKYNLTRYIYNGNSIFLDQGRVLFCEYTIMSKKYFWETVNINDIHTVKYCIEICKQTINSMKDSRYNEFLEQLCRIMFKNRHNVESIRNDFIKIYEALSKLILEVPTIILHDIKNFSPNHSNYFFISHQCTDIGGSPMVYQKNIHQINNLNYHSQNVIFVVDNWFQTFLRENRLLPDLILKSFCEVLIHETAHLSLDLERDKQHLFYTMNQVKNNNGVYMHDYWDEKMMTDAKRIYINIFVNDTSVEVAASNAEHYAIFFVFFYLYITGKGNSVDEIIRNSGLLIN